MFRTEDNYTEGTCLIDFNDPDTIQNQKNNSFSLLNNIILGDKFPSDLLHNILAFLTMPEFLDLASLSKSFGQEIRKKTIEGHLLLTLDELHPSLPSQLVSYLSDENGFYKEDGFYDNIPLYIPAVISFGVPAICTALSVWYSTQDVLKNSNMISGLTASIVGSFSTSALSSFVTNALFNIGYCRAPIYNMIGCTLSVGMMAASLTRIPDSYNPSMYVLTTSGMLVMGGLLGGLPGWIGGLCGGITGSGFGMFTRNNNEQYLKVQTSLRDKIRTNLQFSMQY